MTEDPPKLEAEQFLEEIGLLDQIIDKINTETSYDFAENCFEFYSKHGKLDAFLKWTMKREVERTSEKV